MQVNKQEEANLRPIALFDSGVGGLSVLSHITQLLPHENIIYFADQANVPYGSHPLEEINAFCHEITCFLLTQQAKLIVVACNTASAAALSHLRMQFPDVAFVGMEPAVKPAAHSTASKVVGVMATAGTFSSERYASLMETYANEIQVLEDPCLGLVELIESGDFESPTLIALLNEILQPMLDADMDTLVLGCTHYPFVLPAIREIVGERVHIIDPAPAVALQTERLLRSLNVAAPVDNDGAMRFITSGAAEPFAQMLSFLIGYEGELETAVYQNHTICLMP